MSWPNSILRATVCRQTQALEEVLKHLRERPREAQFRQRQATRHVCRLPATNSWFFRPLFQPSQVFSISHFTTSPTLHPDSGAPDDGCDNPSRQRAGKMRWIMDLTESKFCPTQRHPNKTGFLPFFFAQKFIFQKTNKTGFFIHNVQPDEKDIKIQMGGS